MLFLRYFERSEGRTGLFTGEFDTVLTQPILFLDMTYRNCTRIKIDDASPMLWFMTASLLNIQPPLRGCAMYFDLGGNKQKLN